MFNTGLAPNDVKTAIDVVFDSTFSPTVIPGYANETSPAFMQDTIDRAAVIIEQIQHVGYFETKSELQDVPAGTARIGNQIVYTVKEFAKEVDIPRTFMADDQHSAVNKMIAGTGRLARITREREGFKQFNLGFSTVVSNDAVALFSNSHLTLNGDTVDNLETGVLNESNLDVLIQSLLNQKTQDGTYGGHVPTCLLVPSTGGLLKKANEVVKSELRSGTANNDLNYYSTIYPGLQVYFSPFLGATNGVSGSSLQYYVLSQEHSMKRWVREDLWTRTLNWEGQRNNNYVFKTGFREVYGPVSYEGLVASNGTV